MKNSIIALSALTLLLFAGCGPAEKDATGKIRLSFNPVKDKPVKISYSFSVNSIASKAVSSFDMELSGTAAVNENGLVTLELKNDAISMEGDLQGQHVKAVAGSADTIAGDLKLVAMPVFSLLGKSYRSTYTPQFDKRSEVQVNGTSVVDSTENKMQIYVRYPDREVGVGDTWEKELMIKSGSKMNCSARYSLKEIKGDSAVISIDGKLYGNGESFGNQFTIDGRLNGTFTVDVHTGWPLNTAINEEFTLKMDGRDLPMKYSIKSKVQ